MAVEKFYELSEKKALMKRIADLDEVVGGIVDEFDHEFFKDKEIVLALAKRWGGVLNYCDNKMKKDKEITLAAVKDYGPNILFADKKFKSDKDVVRAALFHNKDNRKKIRFDSTLRHIDEKFKKTKEFKEILKKK